MRDTKIIREFVDLEQNTVLDVDTFQTRILTADEQDKIHKLIAE